jgi:integrase
LELDADPTHGVKRAYKVAHEHEPWPQELIERFLHEARPSLRWAVKLALYTGRRRSDLVKMKWSQFDGEYIEVRQQKTGALLSIPRRCGLSWKSMPRIAETILVGELGVPLTGDSLSMMIRRQLREMGVDGYAIHGLRKNAVVALADAGCDAFEIAAITGHRTMAMVGHYARRHDQRRRANPIEQKNSAKKAIIGNAAAFRITAF